MPDISEIVDVTITVQSAALSRKGFNSLMIIGNADDFDSGFTEYEVRSYSTAAQLGADVDVLPGNVKDMATVAFAQTPSVSEVFISRVDAPITGGTAQLGNMRYYGQFRAGQSVGMTLDGNPIPGSPFPFDTDNATTLDNVNTALQAMPEVLTSADLLNPNYLDVTGVIGVPFTLNSTITGTTDQACNFTISQEVTAGQSYQWTVDATQKTVPFDTDWETTLHAIGAEMLLDVDLSAPGAVYTIDALAKTVNIQGTEAAFDGTFTQSPESIGPGAGGFTAVAYNATYLPTSLWSVTTPAATGLSSADLDAIAANNNEWFGLTSVFSATSDVNIQSAWGAANKKYGFYRTIVISNDLNLNSNYSSVWYTDGGLSGTAAPLEVAIASRCLAEIPGSYTAAFKTLELVSPTQLTATQEATLRSNRTNQYTAVSGRNITWDGVTTGQGYIDIYVGVLYLEARIAEDVFAYMASVDKVPYTNAGIDAVVGKVQARLDQSVVEQFLAGDPQPLAEAPRVTEISATDKSNRLLPNVTFTATASGAVHTVQIIGTVIA